MNPKTRSITDKDLNPFERRLLKNIQKYGWTVNHYEEYPVLQCFWPDRHGYYPWDGLFDKRMRKSQPMLYESSVEKTGLPKSLLVDEPWKFSDSPDTACFTSDFVLNGSRRCQSTSVIFAAFGSRLPNDR